MILPAAIPLELAGRILTEHRPHNLQLVVGEDGAIQIEDPWFSYPARLDSEETFRAQVTGLLTGADTPVHVWRYGYASTQESAR